MSDTPTGSTPGAVSPGKFAWHFHPPLPLEPVPVFAWPPRPLAALRYLFSLAHGGSVFVPFSLLAIATWTFWQPALERCTEFRPDWIGEILVRNLVLITAVATALQLYFYRFGVQGKHTKYDGRDYGTRHRKYFSGHQLWDNVFYTLVCGVPLWSAYEVLFFWAYANGYAPVFFHWQEHPVWFVVLLLLIPFFTSMHFYFVHRLLHWRPLYRLAHHVHHRNDHTGPWSGFSMHPVEQVIYLSSVLVHFLLLSHPIHLIFHCQWNTIGAAVSHSGFETITWRGRPLFYCMSFHHQLHHRFYDCNYGNAYMPWDRWMGTDHDGTESSWAALKRKRRRKLAAQRA